MARSSWLAVGYALVLGAAGPLASCAGTDAADATSASGQTALAESRLNSDGTAQASASAYTDAQVEAFVAARDEIQQLTPGQTIEEQAANQQRISQILQRHNLTPDVYTAIEAASSTDQALANRIAAASVGTEFSDAQLQAFVAASAEIDPLNRRLATATPAERVQIANDIRGALQRHNLNLETYNGIAARAQSDPQLSARIAQLRAMQTPSEG